jgi:hypothetical protein
MDKNWWDFHHEEAARNFAGRQITTSRRCYHAETLKLKPRGKNSGCGAISLAASWGARRIVLLGYDCKYAADGARHWHGDHPKGLGNAVSMPKWMPQFEEVATRFKALDIVNASRDTDIEFWPRVTLESALAET